VTALDDFDARPSSVTSLARTVIGLYLRPLGGWISTADLVRVMQQLGVEPGAARTAVARLKERGLLDAALRGSVAGYRLDPAAIPMLEAGDRRIFQPRRMASGDPWCLVSFSIPEDQRPARHQLRRRLTAIGCGTVSPALWICPATLGGEVEQILDDIGVRDFATLFETSDPRPVAVAEWWDLDGLAALHRGFIADVEQVLDSGDDAFARYVRGIDLWRPIPYLDPGLADDLLPADWPGHRSERLYERLSDLAPSAGARLTELVG
jgi:phenylacetic acid degradation operon negative regulatory protein